MTVKSTLVWIEVHVLQLSVVQASFWSLVFGERYFLTKCEKRKTYTHTKNL